MGRSCLCYIELMPDYLHQHLKIHHPHFTEMNELYISLSFYVFAFGLIGIFVPIYIFNLGFSTVQLAMFFIFAELVRTSFNPFAAILAKRFGPKHILILSYVLMFLYTITLYFLPQNRTLLYFAGILGGIALGTFWMARHIDLATIISEKEPTTEYTTLLIFSYAAQGMAPFIGGVIATQFGIEYGFLVAGGGLILASYPLLKTLEPPVPKKANINLMKTAPINHLIASFAMNVQTMVGVLIWPLFIYLSVETYQDVGAIASATLLLSIFLLRVMGKSGDKGKNSMLLRIGSGFRSIVHVLRAFTNSFLSAFGVNFLGDMSDNMSSIPYTIRFYQAARKYDITAYLTDMEIAGGVGKALPWVIILIAGAHLDLKSAIIITFVMAALLTPLVRLIEPVNEVLENQNK